MKVLIAGAHFTPAQATIEELKKFPGVEIIYIGRNTTMEGDSTPSVESQILPSLNVKFAPLIAGRLRRDLGVYTLISLIKIPIGFIQSFSILIRENPDVILSFGGYVAVPVVVNGWLLSIPIVTHEQTLVSGLANKICSIFANKVAVSFDSRYDFPKDKLVLTGNPIRAGLIGTKEGKKANLPVILILGGNQGSYTINKAIWSILSRLTEHSIVVHQTGESKYKNLESALNEQKKLKHPDRYKPQRWIEERDLGELIREASLVISRAGANTLTELSFFGVPTLVIPLPHLYKDEQNRNARYFEKLGLVEILNQSELTPPKLLDKVREMLKTRESLKKRAQKAKLAMVPNGAQRLTQQVLILGSKYEDFNN